MKNEKITAKDLTDDQLTHILLLDERCRELTNKVIRDVKTILVDIQKRQSEGEHAYDTACIEGSIIAEVDLNNESLKHLRWDSIEEHIITVNDSTKAEMIMENCGHELWFGNWQCFFKNLYNEESKEGIKLSRAFCAIFDWSNKFTLEEIMQIKPDDIFSHIEINI